MKKFKVTKKDRKSAIVVVILSIFSIVLATLLKTEVLGINEKIVFSKEVTIWVLFILGVFSLVYSIFIIILTYKIKD